MRPGSPCGAKREVRFPKHSGLGLIQKIWTTVVNFARRAQAIPVSKYDIGQHFFRFLLRLFLFVLLLTYYSFFCLLFSLLFFFSFSSYFFYFIPVLLLLLLLLVFLHVVALTPIGPIHIIGHTSIWDYLYCDPQSWMVNGMVYGIGFTALSPFSAHYFHCIYIYNTNN